LALVVVRDLRPERPALSAEELADFETDVLAGFRPWVRRIGSTLTTPAGLVAPRWRHDRLAYRTARTDAVLRMGASC
jgi:hypothetical protein